MYETMVVKEILEKTIDHLVASFSNEPYIHRCEHSMHCELYTMLFSKRELQGLYSLKGKEKLKTSLIHKEWPEINIRPSKTYKRGNFDLAILDPHELSLHTVTDFVEGRISPAFVVEMGLNYDLDHLSSDDGKLKNSGCRNGYLVHLWQPHRGMRHDNLLKLKEWCEGKDHVAAAVFTKDGLLVKYLKDPALR